VLSVLFNVVEQRHPRSRKQTAGPMFSTSSHIPISKEKQLKCKEAKYMVTMMM
jgi:hypothetical protein